MYYPLSQITSNLFSNKEFILITSGNPYVGYYWKTSDGKFFTGKTSQDTPTEELIPIVTQTKITSDLTVPLYVEYVTGSNNNAYNSIKQVNIKPISIPIYSITLPTQKDYQIGEFIRYFCKKTNEIIYLEINKTTYNKLINKDTNILYDLYQPFNISWKITGSKEQVYKINHNIVELTMYQQKLPQFNKYLKEDYLKYYKKT